MHCIYCGRVIQIDEVIRCQRIGFDTDNESGTVVEMQRLVSTVKCDQCGSQSSVEIKYTNDLLELEADSYVRRDEY